LIQFKHDTRAVVSLVCDSSPNMSKLAPEASQRNASITLISTKTVRSSYKSRRGAKTSLSLSTNVHVLACTTKSLKRLG
jgi:predicted transcriptional regulator